ncbi:hypothetical protein Taro_031472 [Colocasia esculenta]|uniref:Uncharacterized protein n=1 Tax=Colocasia esculenta TaxID=4460 RepID=A0A843W6I6_COLES|nr:hypothetical protein [Colocasia esculenta]
MKAECLKLKKTEFKKKDNMKKFKKYNKKAMAATCNNESDSNSESSSSEEEEEKANQAFMVNVEDKVVRRTQLVSPTSTSSQRRNH